MATAVGCDGLEMMSLEDFLKEAVTVPPVSEDHRWLQWPSRPYTTHSNLRWRGNSRKRGGRGVDAWRSSTSLQARGSSTPSQRSRRDGMRPGVMIAHEPHPRRPFPLRTTPSARPFESVLTLGSHEAPTVKEGSGRQEGDVILDMEAVMTNAQPAHEVNFVLNQPLPVKAGRSCHFLSVQDLASLRRDTILKLLVGMLNTGERGVVYLGVGVDGRVQGVTCEAQMVAQFVEGLMKSIQFYLMPRLHAPQYGVRYTNVFTSKGQILNNVWVVELHAVPKMQHYYNAVMDMDYHIRHDTHTETLPFTSFCNAIVASTSRPYQQETSKLEQQVKLLEKALQERGVDTSSAGAHVCDSCWFTDCPAQCYGKGVVCGRR